MVKKGKERDVLRGNERKEEKKDGGKKGPDSGVVHRLQTGDVHLEYGYWSFRR